MKKPYLSSTYRVQLHAGFNFRQLDDILEYLHELGISAIYASPIQKAIEGSRHGYDVVDPCLLNEEIGTERQWAGIQEKLKARHMSWMQDIVPNHMAFETTNPWIFDLLERGPDSEFYTFFDIIHHPGHGRPSLAEMTGEKLMLPFLGKTLTECLREKELKLVFSEKGFVIRYFEKEYPVAIHLYRWICTITPGCPTALLISFAGLEKAATQSSCKYWQTFRQSWMEETTRDDSAMGHIRRQIGFFGEQVSLTGELVLGQHYLLTNSRLAGSRINYRRFFTINSLICLRMEDERVFSAYHGLILGWYKRGWIQGLRLDHIDGLAAPLEYLLRLRHAVGRDCYIVAEKILQEGENLPENWPIEGTTGYEFLSSVGQVLTDQAGGQLLLDFYLEKIAPAASYEKLVYNRKLSFLRGQMGGELENLLELLESLTFLHADLQDRMRLKDAIASLMASFPIYRLYPDGSPWSGSDRWFIRRAFLVGRLELPAYEKEFDYLETLFDSSVPSLPPGAPPVDPRSVSAQKRRFLSRLMQFTGPLAAKGVEDSVFYIFNPCIAHSEVGDSPAILGITAAEFHKRMLLRRMLAPHALNATTTHDTKRGEDARVRLFTLSAHPQEWTYRVTGWREQNARLAGQVKGRRAPSPNDEYFIYQSILGSFPAGLAATDDYRHRFSAFLVKALREAGIETNYEDPDLGYEEGCLRFAGALLASGSPFLKDFVPFATRIIQEAESFSLSQALIKLTAPGVPDIYQGAELWELSLVDPDNRRSVDYARRMELLRRLRTEEKKGLDLLLDFLSKSREDGAAKLWTIHKTLCFRKDNEELFADGDYIPIDSTGACLAYIRHWRESWALIIVPVPRQKVLSGEAGSLGSMTLSIPPGCPIHWEHVLSNEKITLRDSTDLSLCEWWSRFPVALLMSE